MLNSAITADADWLTVATTAAFSAAVLISAIAEIRVGRIIDHRAPPLPFSWFRNGASGLRVRHDFPLLF
ncbi:hypothetical protein ACFWBM_11460 [Streptomyces sp. NPDC059980]|uniref:hypothetical protein n=1 Tax=Streptomyces sp. NPDC059980 TaxID=3347022 RepID=UPI00368C0607